MKERRGRREQEDEGEKRKKERKGLMREEDEGERRIEK